MTEISSSSNNPLIRFSRVSRFFSPEKAALFDVSINFYPGEFVYVFGPSGAGKSTLLNLIQATEEADTGTVTYTDVDLSKLKPRAIALWRRNIGSVQQDFKLVNDLSVAANVALPLEVKGKSRGFISKKVTATLAKLGLPGLEKAILGTLSGGEQQRVAVARAIVGDPEVILADEPTCSLDAYNANCILDLFEEATERGATVILATHDRMLMAARPHRTISLNEGRVIGMSSDGSESKSNKVSKVPSGIAQAG